MKKARMISTLFTVLCITLPLFSCAGESPQEFNANAQTDQVITDDAHLTQIDYYSSLVADLQDQLINIKEESYIEKQEYILKIEELESLIQLLNDKLSAVAVSGNVQEKNPSPTVEDNTSEITLKPKFEYSISNGEITVTKYIGKETSVNIPTHINGYPVIAIGEEAFKGSSVRSISISQGVRQIDWFAFAECFTLTEITIPSSVTSIGYGAFDLCSSSLLIICTKGSYTEAYARSWGIQTEALK